jgi:hypothetical protein
LASPEESRNNPSLPLDYAACRIDVELSLSAIQSRDAKACHLQIRSVAGAP